MNLASEALVVISGLYRLWLPGSPQHPAFQRGLLESSMEKGQWRKGSALA